MSKYKRLSIEEREELLVLNAQSLSVREIGRRLSRSPSTVSRELKRHLSSSRVYRASWAQKQSELKASSRRKGQSKIGSNLELLSEIKSRLKQYWSPEQIARDLCKRYEDLAMNASKETIYTYIYLLPRGELRAELIRCLRRSHKKRKLRGVSRKGQRSDLEDMISIEERPKEVADRSVPGHWEGDIIIGGQKEQTALGTIVERTTRAVLLVPLKSKKAHEVRKAFTRAVKRIPKELRLSMTYDQGREMAEHKLFTKNTKMNVYFAHPRSPWERGTNENTNGLLRQFFPKGTNFNEVSRYKIKKAQDLLNERPRKTLNWKTPKEAMEELLR